MISAIRFSNLFPARHPSPVGRDDGYYLTAAQAQARQQQSKPRPTPNSRPAPT